MPDFEEDTLDYGNISFHKRKWQTTIFDLATLFTKHKLHIPYQLMDVLLSRCNIEIELRDTPKLEEAIHDIEIIRAMLYIEGVSPFIIPFVTSHSVNEYSGINSRDSDTLRDKLPENLKEGITSSSALVEAWPHELSLKCLHLEDRLRLSEAQCNRASTVLKEWKAIENKSPVVSVSRVALCSAPQIIDMGSSLMHIWQGIEALFPSIQTEVTFRISLLVAQMASVVKSAPDSYEISKKSYRDRSSIAHGGKITSGKDKWVRAWTLLTLCHNSILMRGKLPDEDELLTEILSTKTV